MTNQKVSSSGRNRDVRAATDEILRLQSKLHRLLRHRGRSREDTHDLIQDAFVRLHTYGIKVVVREPEAFLVRTVLNLDVDQRRRERRLVFASGTLENLALSDDCPTPDELIEVQQRLHEIERALQVVSRRTRDMYWMNRIEGYSYGQIARKLQISASAVEKHMARALKALGVPTCLSLGELASRNCYRRVRNNSSQSSSRMMHSCEEMAASAAPG